MVAEDDSEECVSRADLRRERYLAHLTRYCFEVHEAERDVVAWAALAKAVQADEVDPSNLPLPFVVKSVVAPKFWAAGMLSGNSFREVMKLVEEHAVMWRVYRKPKRKPRPRKRRKLLSLIVAALCFSEGLAASGRRSTDKVARVATRLGMSQRQVLYQYDQVCARRTVGDEVFCLATDAALERIASLMWAIDEREDSSGRKRAHAARHYKPKDLETFAAASAAAAKLKDA